MTVPLLYGHYFIVAATILFIAWKVKKKLKNNFKEFQKIHWKWNETIFEYFSFWNLEIGFFLNNSTFNSIFQNKPFCFVFVFLFIRYKLEKHSNNIKQEN